MILAMLAIVCPEELNWFYQRNADILAAELRRIGCSVLSLTSRTAGTAPHDGVDSLLIVSFHECVLDADRAGKKREFIEWTCRFRHRILVNFDSIFSPFYHNHFIHGRKLITAVIDICVARQSDAEAVKGVPYFWVQETLSADQWAITRSWCPGRPLPWAMLGHSNRERAALVEAAAERFGCNGFVFMPPLRPYSSAAGLGETEILKVLQKTNLYLWGSHHRAPYHEGLRAVHSIIAGAIPAKIDPLHFGRFAAIPWVYESLDDCYRAYDNDGPEALYKRARAWFETGPSLATQMIVALERIGVMRGFAEGRK